MPNLREAHEAYTGYLAFVGWTPEAVGEARRAHDVEPVFLLKM
jgi:hypothetical protein